jgi:hypothetical protein
MREATVAKSRTSHELARSGSSEADRFPVVNPRRWGRPAEFFILAFTVAWLVGWIAAGPYIRVAAILTGLATLAFFVWVVRKARRRYETPGGNFVELGEKELRIEVPDWLSFNLAYAEIVYVQRAAHLSMLERTLWTISKEKFSSYLEIGLSRSRLLYLALPWRVKKLFLKPVDLPQLEFALQARFDRFARRQSETRL